MYLQLNNKPLQNIAFKSNESSFKDIKTAQMSSSCGNFSALNVLAIQNGLIAFTGRAKDLTERMKRVLSHVLVTNVSMHHDAALEAIKEARDIGIVSKDKPLTLLHFDTHSDIYKEDTIFVNYGNWINKAIKDGSVDEIYWILPEWTKSKSTYETFWADQNDLGEAEYFLSDSKTKHTFYIDKETSKLRFEKPEDYDINSDKYRVVTLHKITIEELPEMKDKQNIMLDICGDYYTCNGKEIVDKDRVKVDPSIIPGMDTPYPIPHLIVAAEKKIYKRLTIQDIHKANNKIFSELEKKGIKPIIYTGAESPEYVPKNYISTVEYLLKKISSKAPNNEK